jgi:hypothetical protein
LFGFWISRGGGGTIIQEFRADGSYRSGYDPPSETGISAVDSGKISITDSVIRVYASTYCKTGQDGYYQATKVNKEGRWYLTFFPMKDDCSDRKNALAREMPEKQ